MHQHQSPQPINPLMLAIKQAAIIALIVFLLTLYADIDPFFHPFDWLFFPAFAFMFSVNPLFLIHAARVPGGIEYRFNIRFGDNAKTIESNAKTPESEEDSDHGSQPFLSRFHYEASERFSIGKRR